MGKLILEAVRSNALQKARSLLTSSRAGKGFSKALAALAPKEAAQILAEGFKDQHLTGDDFCRFLRAAMACSDVPQALAKLVELSPEAGKDVFDAVIAGQKRQDSNTYREIIARLSTQQSLALTAKLFEKILGPRQLSATQVADYLIAFFGGDQKIAAVVAQQMDDNSLGALRGEKKEPDHALYCEPQVDRIISDPYINESGD
ncbi:MAG: hypothetical protein ABIA67_05335 [Candidatus Margulisiibacteriota bacterium]